MKQKIDKVLAQNLFSVKNEQLECVIYVQNMNSAIQDINKTNIKITQTFPFIKAIAINGEKKEISKIISNSNVIFMSAQTQVFAMMNIAREILNVNNSNMGKDVTMAYIDTGISSHMDFVVPRNRIIKFIDLINNQTTPYDDNGHGTFVSGVGSGNGLLSNKKYAGICGESNIISIKALNQDGEANASKILEAMQWVYDNHKKFNIKVVCMSFGSEPLGENDPIMKGANTLWDSGITVVAAAGNSGPSYHTIKSPGVSPKIITVGGFDDNRINEKEINSNFFEIAKFSSCGPSFNVFKPDLVAPAVEIISCGIEKPYIALSGTSVATPMIAGICALYLSSNKNLTPNMLKRKILSTCKPINFNKNKEGFGRPIYRK